MLKKQAWIIPVNTAVLFGILCFWSIQNHDTLWAVVDVVLCLLNVYLAFTWLRMRRPDRP